MMSILVNTSGQVCVASDNHFAAMPEAMSFNPVRRVLTLMFDNGEQQELGTAGLSEISRLLNKVNSVRFMMLRPSGTSAHATLPLYVGMDNYTARAVAV